MSDNPHPNEGGRYVRHKDGTLKRAEDATPLPTEVAPAAKPSARSSGKKAKE